MDGTREGYVPSTYVRVTGSPEERAILAEAELGGVPEEVDEDVSPVS